MSVEVRKFEDGSYALGAIIEGAFVPFVSHPKGRVPQYVERHATLTERAKAGDQGAVAALGVVVKAPPTKKDGS